MHTRQPAIRMRTSEPFHVARATLSRAIVSLLIAIVALATARAAPVVDTLYGVNGIVRIAETSGAEETVEAALRQPDGRLLVAGQSNGRDAYLYVVRFSNAGTLDAAFGNGGVVLLDASVVQGNVRQLALTADGQVLVAVAGNGAWYVMRLTPAGVLDATFGIRGVYRRASTAPVLMGLVQQSDGALLVAAAAAGALQVTRLTASGSDDAAFGQQVIPLPADFSPVARPFADDGQGGFIAKLSGTVRAPDGTIVFSATPPFALLHVVAGGTLDAAFGNGGIVMSADLGIPYGDLRDVIRSPGGGWWIATTSATDPQGQASQLLLRLDGTGKPDAAFGASGRSAVPSALLSAAGVFVIPLADGGALLVSGGGPSLRVARFSATGPLDGTYGSAGIATVEASGYQYIDVAAGFADASNFAVIAGTFSRILRCPIACFTSGGNAAALVLTASGQLASGYGAGGIAAYDRAQSSSDEIDTIYTQPSGAAVVAGFSSANGTTSLLVERVTRDGVPDPAFGNAGRVLVPAGARCYGPAQAAGQADGSIVVTVGAATGGLCNVGAASRFRLDAAGGNAPFAATFAFDDLGNATEALVARPDGRILHGASKTSFGNHAVILDQALPDGTPDPQFGSNGRVTLAIAGDATTRGVSLLLLPDGSAIAAAVTSHGLALYKVDAAGTPVAGFGTGGAVIVPGEFTAASAFGRAVGLAVLSDTSIYVQFDASEASGNVVRALRLSSSGAVLSSLDLPAGTSRATLVALADDSIVIAGSTGSGAAATAVLRRLNPDFTLDASFGPAGAYAVPGLASIAALATTIDGNLIVGGADATSAVLMRLVMASVVAPATVVEFHHAALDHYFVTANPLEAAAVDGGAAGPGWSRTGLTFRSGGANKVCRFYGNAARNPATGGIFGPNSHFYTATPSECAFLVAIFTPTDKSWHLESYDFATTPPVVPAGAAADAAACPAGTVPVYRAYNRGFERGEDSNHRLTSSLAAYQSQVATGWAGEGIRMCAPPDVAVN